MNVMKNNATYCFSVCFQVIQIRLYAVKTYHDVHKRDSEVHQFVSRNKRPNQNFLAAFGVTGTGALGIKQLINYERKLGNLVVARKPCSLLFFNDLNGVKTSIRNVACGYGFTLFSGRAKPSWQVYGCGLNNDSQLGFQDVPLSDNGNQIIIEPRLINLPCLLDKISHISCGRAHSIVVGHVDSANRESQIIYSFGNNMFGQCGREIIENEIFLNNTIIHKMNFSKRIKQVECGEFNTYFLTEDGSVYGCGSNMHGQLANRVIGNCSNMVKLGGNLEGEVVKQISSRSNTVLALTEKGEVWAWGDNQFGLVFSEIDESSVTEPCRLIMPDNVGKIVRVSAGNTVCAVVNEEGQAFTWGQFLIGLGPENLISPKPKIIPPGLFGSGLYALNKESSRVIDVQCGVQHCLAITSSGSLYFWGNGGTVKKGSQTFPVRMPLTFNAKRAFIGADHSIIMGSPDM